MRDRPRRLDIFAEDQAHETFMRALVRRLAGEERVSILDTVKSAEGGHPRALMEFKHACST